MRDRSSCSRSTVLNPLLREDRLQLLAKQFVAYRELEGVVLCLYVVGVVIAVSNVAETFHETEREIQFHREINANTGSNTKIGALELILDVRCGGRDLFFGRHQETYLRTSVEAQQAVHIVANQHRDGDVVQLVLVVVRLGALSGEEQFGLESEVFREHGREVNATVQRRRKAGACGVTTAGERHVGQVKTCFDTTTNALSKSTNACKKHDAKDSCKLLHKICFVLTVQREWIENGKFEENTVNTYMGKHKMTQWTGPEALKNGARPSSGPFLRTIHA